MLARARSASRRNAILGLDHASCTADGLEGRGIAEFVRRVRMVAIWFGRCCRCCRREDLLGGATVLQRRWTTLVNIQQRRGMTGELH